MVAGASTQKQGITDCVAPLLTPRFLSQKIVHHGVLDEDINFLPKPLSAQTLIAKVEDVLARGDVLPDTSEL